MFSFFARLSRPMVRTDSDRENWKLPLLIRTEMKSFVTPLGFSLPHAESLIEQGGPMVLICAPPKELLAAVDEPPSRRPDTSEQELDEGSDSPHGDQRLLISFPAYTTF